MTTIATVIQDGDEAGLPGVRLVTATGLAATTDTQWPLPHYLRDRADENAWQQLRPEARRSHIAEPASGRRRGRYRCSARLAVSHCVSTSARRSTASSASTSLMPSSSRARSRCAVQWRHRVGILIEELQKASGGAAPVLRRRHRAGSISSNSGSSCSRARSCGSGQTTELLLRTRHRAGSLLAARRTTRQTPGSDREGEPMNLDVEQKASVAPVGLRWLGCRWLAQENVDEAPIGEAVETSPVGPMTRSLQWVQDPERLATEEGDQIETRETVQDGLETIKLSEPRGPDPLRIRCRRNPGRPRSNRWPRSSIVCRIASTCACT